MAIFKNLKDKARGNQVNAIDFDYMMEDITPLGQKF